MKNIFKSIADDFKLIFSRDGRKLIKKGKQDKHFWYSFFIGIPFMLLFTFFNKWVSNTGIDNFLFGIFICGGFTWLVNAIREEYYDRKERKTNPLGNFDWRDVRFGWYGGLLSGLVTLLILRYS